MACFTYNHPRRIERDEINPEIERTWITVNRFGQLGQEILCAAQEMTERDSELKKVLSA